MLLARVPMPIGVTHDLRAVAERLEHDVDDLHGASFSFQAIVRGRPFSLSNAAKICCGASGSWTRLPLGLACLQLLDPLSQGAVTFPAFGDVTDDRGHPGEHTRWVMQDDDVELDRNPRPILAHGRHRQHLAAVAARPGL